MIRSRKRTRGRRSRKEHRVLPVPINLRGRPEESAVGPMLATTLRAWDSPTPEVAIRRFLDEAIGTFEHRLVKNELERTIWKEKVTSDLPGPQDGRP